MKKRLSEVFNEKVSFSLLLGLFPAVAMTSTFEDAYMMSLCVLIIMFLSSILISLIKKIISDKIRMFVYILIVGIFLTIVEITLQKYVPDLFASFGIYLSLIIISGTIIGVNTTSSNKEKNISKTFITCLVFTLVMLIISIVREVGGGNTITLMDKISSFTGYRLVYKDILPVTSIFPISIFSTSSGAFIILAFLVALFNKIKGGKKHESN